LQRTDLRASFQSMRFEVRARFGCRPSDASDFSAVHAVDH
jgi:hypothetical protein